MMKAKSKKRLSENTLALMHAQEAIARSFDSLVKNEVCRVTRFHADGRREVVHLPSQQFDFEKFLPAEPLTAKGISDVREAWNITQLQMARRLKVPVVQLRNWEKGLEMPTGKVALLLQVMCLKLHPD